MYNTLAGLNNLHFEGERYITDISLCGADKNNHNLPQGIIFDSKVKGGYSRGQNSIPLILVDSKAKGTYRINVRTLDGCRDIVLDAIGMYAAEPHQRMDEEMSQHIRKIQSLDEVADVRLGRFVESMSPLESGINSPRRLNGHYVVTVVGMAPYIGRVAEVMPQDGKYTALGEYLRKCEQRS